MLIIDCQSAGIGGDMILSSLVDLGADKRKVLDSIFATEEFLDGSKILDAKFEECKRYNMRALFLKLEYEDSKDHRDGIELYDAIDRCANKLSLEPIYRTFALNSIRTIIDAEAYVHGESFNTVHLHEAASIDTVIDIIGTAMALQDLRILNSKVYSTKIAIGGGLLNFSHGIVSNPGNAILYILKDRFKIVGGPIEEELTTPTGASILANLAESSLDYYPMMRIKGIGYGAGKNDFKALPNILKVVHGDSNGNVIKESIIMLETDIDDLDGEALGDLIDTLYSEGARDVNVLTSLTKKNRAGFIIRVISDNNSFQSIIESLFKIGTLGVRVEEIERYILARSMISFQVNIRGQIFSVRAKIARYNDNIINVKAEYDDIKHIAERTGLSLQLVKILIDEEIAKRFKL